MKIGFSTNYIGAGGARTWIRNFSEFCMSNNLDVSFGCIPCVDLFVSVANLSTIDQLEIIKKNNIKILQRLGAIYLPYNELTHTKITAGNNNLKNIISYSDSIIYQSRFSKSILFGSIYDGKEPDGHIIYNSVNPHLFSPEGSTFKRPEDKTLLLCIAYWGTYHTAKKTIDLLTQTAQSLTYRKDIIFWVLGLAYPDLEEELLTAKLSNITKINLHTAIDYRVMPAYLRTADMVLHLKVNEGCSNLIIESMHTGTPVVGLNSGSLPELVGDAALLAACSNDLYSFPHIDISDLCQHIITTADHLNHYKKKILDRASLFSYKNTNEKYMNIMNRLLSE